MKQIFSLFLILSLIVQVHAQTDNVLEYLNFFNSHHIAVNNVSMDYLQYSVHKEDINEIDGKRQEVVAQLTTSIDQIKQAPAFGEDNSLKEDALKVYQLLLKSFSGDFTELFQLKLQSQTSFEAMEKYFAARKATEKQVEEASKKYLNAQINFAKKYNIELIEAEQNNDVEVLNRLNNYHQSVFLRYFKVNILNNDFMDALNTQDTEKATQVLVKLKSVSAAELKLLEAMPAFDGDDSYKNAAIALVKDIKELSAESYPTLLNILKKPQSELTQEDVEQFNSIIATAQGELPTLNNNVNMAGNNLLKKFVPAPRVGQRL